MLARQAAALAPRLAVRTEAVLGTRSMSAMGGLKGYDDREAAEEMLFFKKEDEKLLRRLLSKVRHSAEKHDKHAAVGALETEKSALLEVVGKYKMSDADIKALLAWKHHSDH